jgi:hypothetical protein
MSTLDGVMLFGQSQRTKVHFENQRVLFLREKVMSWKSRRLQSVEGLTHCAERRRSHPPDTDSRLLTELNRSQFIHDKRI